MPARVKRSLISVARLEPSRLIACARQKSPARQAERGEAHQRRKLTLIVPQGNKCVNAAMAPIIEVQNVSKRFGNCLPSTIAHVGRGRLDHRPDRPQRRRQDDAVQHGGRRLPPSQGRILLAGEDVTGLAAHELYHRGLLRTFQIAHEFSHLTALENLMVVPAPQSGENLFSRLAGAAPGRHPGGRGARQGGRGDFVSRPRHVRTSPPATCPAARRSCSSSAG
jgi:hypothetical protein